MLSYHDFQQSHRCPVCKELPAKIDVVDCYCDPEEGFARITQIWGCPNGHIEWEIKVEADAVNSVVTSVFELRSFDKNFE